MDSVREGIRLNLVDLFERTGKSQQGLADECGIGKSAVSNWVSGSSSIGVDRIPAICDYFGITIDEFFGRSREMQPEEPDDVSELVAIYKALDEPSRNVLLATARALSE